MTLNEKLEKALSNVNHLNLTIVKIYNTEKNVWNNGEEKVILDVIREDGKLINGGSIDFWANFGWCPYCNEGLGDNPFCSQCGEVSGAPEEFYEYGNIIDDAVEEE